ncbi:hypothetical protein SKAU_G00367490 [Synaphobranchus kaupii]|uniref:Uncharacterized protein n=1 Tax=Synaphobranchus kaupii TaxID=118154 RepID=A0A9Q1IDH4_SYNKA|nr:hypothetical protein SKAU_G00367490 [Synaphobranchus kaupii]
MTTNVIIQQPQAVQSNQWSTGICDCFDDLPVCCLGYWCFPCLTCKTTADFGECICLPLLDILWTATQFFGIPICVPPVSFALRVGVRYRYGIEGDMCSDCIYATCCNICSWCQVAREIKRRKSGPAIVSTRPTVISTTSAVAPQPMLKQCPRSSPLFGVAQITTSYNLQQPFNLFVSECDRFTSAALTQKNGADGGSPLSREALTEVYSKPRVDLADTTTADFGECCCLPLLDILWTAAGLTGIPVCVPPVAFALRVGVRYRYGIEGDMCSDCIYATFCNICSWCQVAREIKRRKSGPAMVSTRPTVITTTTTAAAPQPMFMAPQPMFMAPQPMLMASQPMLMASQPAYVTPQPMSTQSTVVM